MRTSGERGVAVKQDGGGMTAPANIVSLRFVTLVFWAAVARAASAERGG